MSLVVPAFAESAAISVVATKQLATFSKGAYRTYRTGIFSNVPSQPILLADTPAGSAQVQSGVFSATLDSTIVIDAYGGFPVFYEVGVSAVVKEGRLVGGQLPAASSQDATGTLTAAQLFTGRLTSTGVTAPSQLTLPTGTLLAAASTFAIGEFFEWSVLNTGANVVNLIANTDHTIVGGAGAAISIPTLASVLVRTWQVSAGVFVTEAVARPVN